MSDFASKYAAGLEERLVPGYSSMMRSVREELRGPFTLTNVRGAGE